MSCHNRLKNGRNFYLEIKGNFKTEAYEETKASNANAIIHSAHYDGIRKFTLEHYYNLVAKAFAQLEEAGNVYTLTEAHKINSFETGLQEPTAINFTITEKRERNKITSNKQIFDTYYNSMKASYGIIQSLVHTPQSRVTQNSNISILNTGVRGRGGRRQNRG